MLTRRLAFWRVSSSIQCIDRSDWSFSRILLKLLRWIQSFITSTTTLSFHSGKLRARLKGRTDYVAKCRSCHYPALSSRNALRVKLCTSISIVSINLTIGSSHIIHNSWKFRTFISRVSDSVQKYSSIVHQNSIKNANPKTRVSHLYGHKPRSLSVETNFCIGDTFSRCIILL